MTGPERRAGYGVLFIMLALVGLGFFLGFFALVSCTSSPPRPPEPPIPTPPAGLPLIHITGNRFIPPIVGVAAGSGSIKQGWPDASPELLLALKTRGLNYVHTRTGPFIREGEDVEFEGYKWVGGGYDLGQFNDAYDKKERDFLQKAQDSGIYVERVVLDDWPAKYGLWPYAEGRNVQGINFTQEVFSHISIPPMIEAWVRHRVANTCSFTNVLYQLDNEPAPVRTSASWTQQLYRIVKEEIRTRGCPDHPTGSANTDAWDAVDYFVIHTFRVPAISTKPVLVNEDDNRDAEPMEKVLHAYLGAARGGVYYQYWPGPNEESLAAMTQAWDLFGNFNRTPTVLPVPNYGCPPSRGIKVEILQVQGTKYVMNSSPLPPSEGADPHSSLGNGLCEDLWANSSFPMPYQDGAGPLWRIVQGPGSLEENNKNPYLAFLFDPVAGQTVVEACLRSEGSCGRYAF